MTDGAAPTTGRDDVIVLDHVRKHFGTFVAVDSADFGIGRGYQPKEFTGLGVSMERTRERFDEGLEVIRRAWTEDQWTF